MGNSNGNVGGNPGHGGENDHLVTITVNGTSYDVEKGLLSYERLLEVISAAPLPENQRYSVVYSKGNSDKPTGTLIEGESVKVKKDMEFDVTPATRS
jgi:hypothetical protein